MEISVHSLVFQSAKITVYLKASSKDNHWCSRCDQLYEGLGLFRVGENTEKQVTR